MARVARGLKAGPMRVCPDNTVHVKITMSRLYVLWVIVRARLGFGIPAWIGTVEPAPFLKAWLQGKAITKALWAAVRGR